MNALSIIKVALRALNRNKMRSALTMLGIVIGVGAVIAMVSIGQGAQRTVQNQIQSIGTNVVFVWPGSLNSNGVRLGAGASNSLTEGDVEAIERECPSVAAASAIVRSSAKRSSEKGAISSGVWPVATSWAICSPPTGMALKPQVPQPVVM